MSDEDNDRTTVSVANLEQDSGDAALQPYETPSFTAPVHIHVTSYRKRLCDPDGISVKAVLDGIVALGILTDDTAKQVTKITFEVRKATGEEKTEIQIED